MLACLTASLMALIPVLMLLNRLVCGRHSDNKPIPVFKGHSSNFWTLVARIFAQTTVFGRPRPESPPA
jgi:hypothetical protein